MARTNAIQNGLKALVPVLLNPLALFNRGWDKEFVMEIQIKLGAKAMGCSALEKNEGSNPDAAKVNDHF